MFRGRPLLLAVAIAIVPFARGAIAQDLEPKVYKSRSGEYALTVDREDRKGAGKGRYAMMRGRAKAWSAELPFTLWDAVVADDGVVGGYAYTGGYERDDGEFIVAIIDAAGKIRMSERAPRAPSNFLHVDGDPKATGLLLDEPHDRFVVRVANPDVNVCCESWWTYRLHDGALLAKPKPTDAEDEQDLVDVRAAAPVAGTPLTLVQWMRASCCNTGSNDFGTVFALVDADAKPVWKLALPHDYVEAERDPQDSIMGYVREHGAILDATAIRRFDLWHVADAMRVSYVVEDGADGSWRVRETGRRPQTQVPADRTASAAHAASRVDLPRLGTIALESFAAGTSAIHDVYDFGIADRGRFAFLTGCGCSGKDDDAALAVVDRQGRLLAKVPLPATDTPRESLRYREAWLGGDRWIVTRSPLGVEAHSIAFVVDAAARSASRLDAFDAPEIEALASTRDGGFVALTSAWHKFTSTDSLAAYDADGRLRWSIGGDYGDESKLFSAADVTVTTRGDVVVLENVAAKLKVYDRAGVYQRTSDLQAAAYLSHIEADADGGVIVRQSNEKAPFVEMKLDGTLVRPIVPAFSDGRRFDARGNIQAAADGSLWTSDGGAFLRIDTRGVVQEVVGSRAQADVLDKVAALAVSGSGRIYAADERTAAVHVFDGAGKRLRVCHPDTHDYNAQLILPSLTAADSGDVFITRRYERSEDDGIDFVHYDASCARIGIESVGVDPIAQRWYAQRGTTNRWVLGFEHVWLVDAHGQTVREIERQANGRWLQPDAAATAADGSIAVVSDRPDMLPVPESVTVYTRGGDAVETWPFPAKPFLASIAYDGRTIALLTNERDTERRPEVTLFDTRTGATRVFAPPAATDSSAIFIVTRNSIDELWVSDGGAKIERYALQ